MTYYADLTHFLDDDGFLAPGRPGVVGLFYARIAAAASLHPTGRIVRSALRCRRRPGRRPCPGHLSFVRHDDGQVEWGCSHCDDNGFIHGWEGALWDRRRFTQGGSGEGLQEVILDEADFTEVRKLVTLEPASEAILDGAVLGVDGVHLRATAEDFDDLAVELAVEADQERRRVRRQSLERVCERLTGGDAGSGTAARARGGAMQVQDRLRGRGGQWPVVTIGELADGRARVMEVAGGAVLTDDAGHPLGLFIPLREAFRMLTEYMAVERERAGVSEAEILREFNSWRRGGRSEPPAGQNGSV